MSINKLLIAVAAAALIPAAAMAADMEDAESSTHGFEAAQYQEVDTYKHPGFEIVQYDLATLSHFSYVLVSEGEALVVDPGRDIDTYLTAAQERGVKIAAVWLTHSHADFVAGQIELAKALDVPIYISRHANAEYKHVPLKDGDTLKVGNSIVTFLETPGHTPDSMCGLVANAAGSLRGHATRRFAAGRRCATDQGMGRASDRHRGEHAAESPEDGIGQVGSKIPGHCRLQ